MAIALSRHGIRMKGDERGRSQGGQAGLFIGRGGVVYRSEYRSEYQNRYRSEYMAVN